MSTHICVEQGRWAGERAHRASGCRASYAVRQGNLIGEERGSAQFEVRSRVSRYDRELAASPTSSMLDHLHRIDEQPIRRMSGQRGVIAGIGGRWDGLVRAAQLDARLAPRVATPAQAARHLVRALGRATLRDGGAAGAAGSVRSDGGRLQVSGVRGLLGASEPLLHLTAFDATHPLLAAA